MKIEVQRGKIGSRSQQNHFDQVSEQFDQVSDQFDQVLTGEAIRFASFAVEDLPDAADNEGRIVRVEDGDAGSPCLAISDGTDWLVIALGAAVSAE